MSSIKKLFSPEHAHENGRPVKNKGSEDPHITLGFRDVNLLLTDALTPFTGKPGFFLTVVKI